MSLEVHDIYGKPEYYTIVIINCLSKLLRGALELTDLSLFSIE